MLSVFILESYRDLVTCRTNEGGIPWTAVRLYGRDKGLYSESFDVFWKLIRSMDQAEKSWWATNNRE